MTIITKLRTGTAGKRTGISAAFAVIACALFMAGCTVTWVDAVQPARSPGSAPTATSPSAPRPAPTAAAPAFDGKAVYYAAFVKLRDQHVSLIDPAARATFVAKWQHKHDSDNVLSSEKGTDMAVFEMMWSLGERFDFYYQPEQTKAEHQQKDATIGGIGLPVTADGLARAIKALGPNPTNEQIEPLRKLTDERPLVVDDTPDKDTPAGLAQIAKGDRILAVDDKNVNGKTLDEVVDEIRGPAASMVTLTILHKDEGGNNSTRRVVLNRTVITVHVVKTDYQGRIVHIRMSNFMSRFGINEMSQALETASGNNTAGVILDLRGNPGGLVDQVLKIAQMFIDEGVVMKEVQREGDHVLTTTYSITHDAFLSTYQLDDGSPAKVIVERRIPMLIPATMPVLVLINENSASASEILAGALQARGRARVIGQPSLGKGVGQLVDDFSSERSMHVTNFEFFPGGIKINWIGIVPDIEVKLPADAEGDFDSIVNTSADTQLNAAKLELIESAIGSPSPPRSQTDIDARRADLEKTHRDNFQREVQARQEVLKKAASDAAAAANVTGKDPSPGLLRQDSGKDDPANGAGGKSIAPTAAPASSR